MSMNTRPETMTNSHILLQRFEYCEPASIAEALALLREHGSKARLLAGGTHLLVMMKMEREAPEVVIGLQRIPGLDTVEALPDGGLKIGAAVTIRALAEHPVVRSHYPALAEACDSFGSTQIQMMATLGGNLCNGSPASDTVPALLALNAQLVIAGPDGENTLPVESFCLGPGKTCLQSDEILVGVILPPPPAGSLSLFVKVARVTADLAKVNLALTLIRENDRIAECRIAFGAVAPTVIRLHKTEAALAGCPFTPEVLAEARENAGKEISPIDDVRSTAWYRRELAGVMLHDALTLAWERSSRPIEPVQLELQAISEREMLAPAPLHNGKHEITLFVNGSRHQLTVAPNALLLNVLREELELTGSKYGCGIGECGACTVQLDGRPVLGCLVLAAAAHGHAVVTVEGLQQPDGKLNALQQAFIDEGAFQCGYCTPGMLMTAQSLLDQIAQPDETQIRDYLKGNRCRCTGYASIVRAVQRATEQ